MDSLACNTTSFLWNCEIQYDDGQVAGVMVPLLKFYFHEEVRSAAAQSLPELLRSAVLASEKGQTQTSSVKQLLDALWQPLIDAIQKVAI